MLDNTFNLSRLCFRLIERWRTGVVAMLAILAPLSGATDDSYWIALSAKLELPKQVAQKSPFLDADKADVIEFIQSNSKHEWIRAERYANAILAASQNHRVPVSIISGVIFTESTFRHNVRSKRNAVGLTQIRPLFWADRCPDLDTARGNIDCGALVLREYRDRCGNWTCALAWYNGGPKAYRTRPAVRRQADAYAQKVLAHASTVRSVQLAQK